MSDSPFYLQEGFDVKQYDESELKATLSYNQYPFPKEATLRELREIFHEFIQSKKAALPSPIRNVPPPFSSSSLDSPTTPITQRTSFSSASITPPPLKPSTPDNSPYKLGNYKVISPVVLPLNQDVKKQKQKSIASTLMSGIKFMILLAFLVLLVAFIWPIFRRASIESS